MEAFWTRAQAKSTGTRGRFHSTKLDGKTYYVVFQAEWGWDAQGSVEIFVEKRHMREDDIQSLTNDRNAAQRRLNQANDELSSITQRALDARNQRRKTAEKIIELQKDNARISKDSFPIDQFRHKGHYFLTGEVIPTALGYELKTVATREMISNKDLFGSLRAYTALNTEKERHEKFKKARESAAKLFKLDVERKKTVVRLLRTLEAKCQKQLVERTKIMSAENVLFQPHHSSPPRPSLDAAQKKTYKEHTAELSSTISQRTSQHHSLIQTAFEEEATFVTAYISRISAAIDGAENLLVKAERKAAEWQEKIRLHNVALEANQITRTLMDSQSLTIGQFTVLRKALQRGKENPWMALYAEQVTVQDVKNI
ncbi:hypothetical protein EG329_000626 [Mollisiaceae sp. DMI_Dod_QoI]|nr:hypothetical protein EG329_000626 [Helotiales sp. DMI_Dod_QoI]